MALSNSIALLSCAYFPPVEYFHILAEYPLVAIEAFENYQKQSYRSRCVIYASEGPCVLQLPICHDSLRSEPISATRIDYSKNWLHQHKIAIMSAYRSSSFFEYYWDDIVAILDSKPERLFDLNFQLTKHIANELGLRCTITATDHYYQESEDDFRNRIHPKAKQTIFEPKPYYQIFSEKAGFYGNLSILDLLFHEGPQAIDFL